MKKERDALAWLRNQNLSEGALRTLSGSVMLALAGGILWLPLCWQRMIVVCIVMGLWVEAIRMLRFRPGEVRSYLITIFACINAGVGGYIVWYLLGRPDMLGLICVSVWSSDIFAYIVGKRVGGPKLAPRISPHKTWSGSIAGLVSGVLGGLFYNWIMFPAWGRSAILFGSQIPMIVGIIVSAQLGDLAESAVKRFFGVKDSGNLIPGHGGLWDRLDGLLFGFIGYCAIIVGFGLWAHLSCGK